MKNIAILSLLFFLNYSSFIAQSAEIDSLRAKLQFYEGDSLADYCLEMSHLFYHLDRDSSLVYSKQALELANKTDYLKAQGRANINIALIKIEKNQNDEATKLLEKALPMALKAEDNLALTMAYANLGILNHYNADYKIAVDYYLIAIEYAKAENNDYEVSRLLYNIADVFNQNKIVDKRNEYYRKAMHYSKISFPYIYVLASVQIADYYSETNQDSTEKYMNQAFELEHEIKAPQILAELYSSRATILNRKSKYKDAESDLLKALVYSKQLNQDYLLSACYCKLGENAMFRKDYIKSSEYYQLYQAHHLISDNDYIARDCLFSWSMLEKSMGNYKKAHDLLLERSELMDSIYSIENRDLLTELESKYEFTKKEAEIEKQKAEIDRKTYKQNLTAGGLGLSLLLGSSLIWGLMNRSKKNKKIALQADHLNSQTIQTLKQEKKLLSMSSLLEGQENERIRIAKDLHDGLGGLLTNVKAHFSKIESDIENLANLDIYASATQMIDKAHDEVRRISHNLMPSDLRAGGLPIAIRQLIHELRSIHEMETDFELVGFSDERLDEKLELTVYRVIQELINNMVKYAKADHAFIQLSKFEKEIQIVVEDNGIGFNFDDQFSSSGLGLKSITSRVEQLNGHIDIVTSKEKGTSFTINIPI